MRQTLRDKQEMAEAERREQRGSRRESIALFLRGHSATSKTIKRRQDAQRRKEDAMASPWEFEERMRAAGASLARRGDRPWDNAPMLGDQSTRVHAERLRAEVEVDRIHRKDDTAAKRAALVRATTGGHLGWGKSKGWGRYVRADTGRPERGRRGAAGGRGAPEPAPPGASKKELEVARERLKAVQNSFGGQALRQRLAQEQAALPYFLRLEDATDDELARGIHNDTGVAFHA